MKCERGFTLMELLVVIAIIGILSAVVMTSLNIARVKGQDAARISDVKSLEQALQLYYNDNNGYPTTPNVNGDGAALLGDPVLSAQLVPNFIPNMPAPLVADGDQYYADGATSGLSTGYDLYIYIAETNSWCKTSYLPANQDDWGTANICNF